MRINDETPPVEKIYSITGLTRDELLILYACSAKVSARTITDFLKYIGKETSVSILNSEATNQRPYSDLPFKTYQTLKEFVDEI
jgi:hypothetical protein